MRLRAGGKPHEVAVDRFRAGEESRALSRSITEVLGNTFVTNCCRVPRAGSDTQSVGSSIPDDAESAEELALGDLDDLALLDAAAIRDSSTDDGADADSSGR